MSARVRIIGSLNVDFTTVTPRVPQSGETLKATSLTISPGGKGANQAVACGRASFISPTEKDAEVEMVGAVGKGDPHYATLLKPALEKSGVNCSQTTEMEGAQTGTATIIVDEGNGGENRILFVPGANFEGMGPTEEVLDKALKTPLPQVFVLQGEIPKETVWEILRRVGTYNHGRRRGEECKVILNPAPVFEGGIPRDLYELIDHLIVNETELDLLAPVKGDVEGAKQFFLDQGVKTVIVTLGSHGATWSSRTTTADKGYEDVAGQVNGIKVETVIDTTAAGDTFVGYYAVMLARWLATNCGDDGAAFGPEEALKRANQAAADAVVKPGAIHSIPWGYEV